ncbi:MAG: NAD(+) kinase [Gammaproteobacteria bacterium]
MPSREANFQTVGVIGKLDDARIAPTLRAICGHLARHGCEVLVERASAGAVRGRGARAVSRDELARRADLAVVVGGDGTLLNAGRTLAPAGVPILGVNAGRLGFMVDVAPGDVRSALDEVLKGRYLREPRLMLSATLRRGRRTRGPFLAINDVVIRNQAAVRMLEFETWLDDEFISLHRADGLIVATPTGSTAYALSGGGPVLHPGLDALAVVPICPHTLSDRPVVIGSDRAVRLVLAGARGTRAMCTADGQHNETVSAGDQVEITRASAVLELIHPRNYKYFNILRNKLHWGRDRNR